MSRRLLVLGCSRRQRQTPEAASAVERYDGPSFRVLRRYLRERRLPERNVRGTAPARSEVSIWVLSAEHGLIPGDLPILPYNRTMTAQRVHELRPGVARRLSAIVSEQGSSTPTDLLVACTRAYLPALPAPEALAALLPPGSRVQLAPVRPGERLACLHDWLHGQPPDLAPSQPTGQPPTEMTEATMAGAALPSSVLISMRLRGQQRTLSAEALLAQAGAALAMRTSADTAPADAAPVSWAVDLAGATVSPKWLVSLGFGLPRSAFGTTDALRVLAALGIAVRRAPR